MKAQGSRPAQLVCVAAAFAAAATARAEPAAWVGVGDQGRSVIRVVVDGGPCPEVEADGRPLPLRLRAGPEPGYPGEVCEALAPAGARAARLFDRPLPLFRGRADRIVVFGDSGCRVHGLSAQNCQDPRAWPLAKVAARAAADRPDLVIHLGDYYYREAPCPFGWRGCVGSPFGDAWATWRADFFDPVRPLLERAPFVFVRGNHEACERGGRGYFRLLDPGAATRCVRDAPAIRIPIGGVTLNVVDSAYTEDRDAPPQEVARFAGDLTAGRPAAGEASWLVTHRPVWGLVPVARLGPFGPLEVSINKTEQAAARASDLRGVELVLSGHIHHFEALSFAGPRPAQLIVGTGGDLGEAADAARPQASSAIVDGLSARRLEFGRFGYFLFVRGAEGWSGAFKDADGVVRARCALKGRALSCVGVGGAD